MSTPSEPDPEVSAILDGVADLIGLGVWPPGQLAFCSCGMARTIVQPVDDEPGIVRCPRCDRA